ncbi:MAG: PKD domain-containing protein [Ginsengibacter sp.]
MANAGADIVIVFPKDSAVLDGSSSKDPDGKIVSNHWAKISGGVFAISKNDSQKTVVDRLLVGIYAFELTVTDDGGLSAKDTVQVTVNDPAIPNRAPIARAGPDQSITSPENTVNLDGGSSTDPDNNITLYEWQKLSGPASYNISNSAAVQVHIIDLVPGTYEFELKVTDAEGLSSRDTVVVVVYALQTGCMKLVPFGALSIPRDFVCAATAGNKVVFAGGNAATGISSRVDIYDIITQSWSTAELSIPRSYLVAATLGSKIFFTDNSRLVDIYDAGTNKWSTTSLNVGRNGISSGAAGNKVVFAGGILFSGKDVDIYDDNTNTISTYSLSTPRSDISTAVAGKKIYFSGGVNPDGQSFSNTVNVFDASNNSWSEITMLQPRWKHASIAADNKIFWAGGHSAVSANGDAISNPSVEVYDINSNKSSNHPLDHTPYFAGIVENKIIFLAPFLAKSFPIDIYDINSKTWSVCYVANEIWRESGWSRSIVAAGNKIYIVGWDAGDPISGRLWTLTF